MLLLFFLHAVLWQSSHAAQVENAQKKFEWGAGFLSIEGNHYRGSDQGKLWLFPVPYFTYFSERIEAEPSFIRGILMHNEWFSLKLNLMLGLNIESEKNKARAGMPPLDYTIEAGPMFIFNLWHSKDNKSSVSFEWPVREIFATDLTYLKHVGLFTVPYLNFKNLPTSKNWHWSSEFSISPMFADQKYHQYFYGVDKQFVRPDRPSFTAHGGYSGFQSALVLNKRFDHLVVIPFIRWDYLKGATFMNSPLVRANNYFIGGLGIFWLFN